VSFQLKAASQPELPDLSTFEDLCKEDNRQLNPRLIEECLSELLSMREAQDSSMAGLLTCSGLVFTASSLLIVISDLKGSWTFGIPAALAGFAALLVAVVQQYLVHRTPGTPIDRKALAIAHGQLEYRLRIGRLATGLFGLSLLALVIVVLVAS
jgi:hypothetical protein